MDAYTYVITVEANADSDLGILMRSSIADEIMHNVVRGGLALEGLRAIRITVTPEDDV